MKSILAAQLDLTEWIKPDDRVLCSHGTAEPQSLTTRLVRDAARLGVRDVFLGVGFSDTFMAEGAKAMRFRSFGAVGTTAALARAGRLEILPMHYSALSRAFAQGHERADVVLLQLSASQNGVFSSGLMRDYAVDAARHARCVIAEINVDAPWTYGAELPEDVVIDVAIEAEHAPLELAAVAIGEVERRIGAAVASLVPDAAVIQIGIGAIPDAVLVALSGHRDLGFHSGVLTDRVVDLIDSGALNNSRKSIDAGISVTGNLFGTRRLRQWAERNRSLRLCAGTYTHDAATLAKIDRLFTINSAIEIDLSGQVNAEVAGGHPMGTVGGQVDFVRAGKASRGGRSIIALPSTARRGAVSRIVPSLSTVTCARSDVDVVVTEWGVAELAGLTLTQRALALIAIAAPSFREALERAWRDTRR